MDKIIQLRRFAFELDDPWVTGEELETGLGFFFLLGTFEGKLSFSIAYNDAWHNFEEATGYLNRCQEIILECAGMRYKCLWIYNFEVIGQKLPCHHSYK